MVENSENLIKDHLDRMLNIFQSVKPGSSSSEKKIARNFIQKVQEKGIINSENLSDVSTDVSGDSFEKVSYYIDLALKTFQNISGASINSEQQANFIFVLSETYETLGMYESALQNYKKALEFATEQGNYTLEGQILYRMGRIYSEMGQWVEANRLLQNSIDIMHTVNDKGSAALSQLQMAKIAYRKGEYGRAQEIFKIALENSQLVNDFFSTATINNHLGTILRMQGKYEKAFEHFQKSLIDFQSIQDKRGTAESLNNLGVVHLRSYRLRDAIAYFEKALEMCHDSGNLPLMAFVYLNKGEFYAEVGDYVMATNACGRALEILVRLKNPIGIAKTNGLLGRIFWKSGDYKIAKAFYQESLQLYQDFWIPLGLANTYQEFGEMLEEEGKIDEAKEIYGRANEIYRKLDIEEEMEESLSSSAK